MTCPCNDTKRKMPRCNAGTPPVLEVHSKECPVLFHTVTIPASIGDLESMPPQPGAYRNARVFYEADKATYLYDSDGIPQLLVPDTEAIIAEAVSQIPTATTGSNGLMSGADKANLDTVSVYNDELSNISWNTGFSLNTGNISILAKVGRVVILNLTIDHTIQLNSGDRKDICTLPAEILPSKNLPLLGMIYQSGTMHSAYVQAEFRTLRFVANANIPAGAALEIFGIWAI